MRASNRVYEEVAEHCSGFDPLRNTFSNVSICHQDVSCMGCRHFDDEEYCELDLYDQIVDNRQIYDE